MADVNNISGIVISGYGLGIASEWFVDIYVRGRVAIVRISWFFHFMSSFFLSAIANRNVFAKCVKERNLLPHGRRCAVGITLLENDITMSRTKFVS